MKGPGTGLIMRITAAMSTCTSRWQKGPQRPGVAPRQGKEEPHLPGLLVLHVRGSTFSKCEGKLRGTLRLQRAISQPC